MFAGNDDFGERAAIAFTILGCCRIIGLNPVEYLADVFPQLARPIRLRDLPDLLPDQIDSIFCFESSAMFLSSSAPCSSNCSSAGFFADTNLTRQISVTR